MKRPIWILSILIAAAIIYSCGNAENKAHREDEAADTNTERKTEDAVIENKPAPAAKPDSGLANRNNEILAKIDQYLVSSPVYPNPPGSGGIVNATVTVKNTLSNITFQKAIVQVSVRTADGRELKSDFYTIQNIEPGDVETIRIPNESKGASLLIHIVKVKSNELTNGEMVLTGSHYDGSK